MGAEYRRILLKLSGEALMGEQTFGISPDVIKYVAEEIQSVHELGVEVAIVVGGGNIFRGIAASSYNMDRASADHMGMLATVINSLALQDSLERRGILTRVPVRYFHARGGRAVHSGAGPFGTWKKGAW